MKNRLIKRYQNRKHYDTFQSTYVTLPEIAQLIRQGNDVRVIDNKTKNDITYKTKIQLLFELERKSINRINPIILDDIIRSESGTFTGFIKESL